MQLDSYRETLDGLLGQCSVLRDAKEADLKQLKREHQLMVDLDSAIDVLQQIAKQVQDQAHKRISSVVTRCLQFVFDDSYEFQLRFDTKRGKTEAVLMLIRDGFEYGDLLNEVGGGVIDVIALALRISCILLARPARQRVLVLDEPFRNVRGDIHKRRLRDLLQSLSDDLDFQFILNVDIDAYPEFAMGAIIEMKS